FFLGEDTAFRAIRALPPDAKAEWCDGRLHLSGGFPVSRAQPLGRDPAIEGYIELFRIAMDRRVRPDEDVGVPLSGGRDARHILLELCRAGRRPKLCLTLQPDPPYPDEGAVAAEIARSVDVPHVVVAQGRSRIEAELQKNRLTNFCSDEHAWYLALGEYLRGRVRHIYDGIGGDVLSAGLFLTVERLALFDAGRFEELAISLLATSESRIRLVAPGWQGRLGRDPAVARLAGELARHAEAPNPVGAFYFWNRTRREIALAPYRILNRSVEVLSPYLDHDLYDFLVSLPASLFLDLDFHSETIRRAYPRYRDLRYEQKEVNPNLGAEQFRRFARETAAYLLRSSLARPAVRLAGSRFVLSRSLLGALVGSSSRFGWQLAAFAIYLLQLSSEMERPQVEAVETGR
ncbi:MAG TPA: asparagine synthase C-terminal domain-containing protein, partial [Gemmatimonadales bacterium]